MQSIRDYVDSLPIVSTHEHHIPFEDAAKLKTLEQVFAQSYVRLCGVKPDTRALSHNYANVYVDLCWLPVVCTSACERALHSLIEAAHDSSRIAWGGDCWLVTESYAGSLAMRSVLTKVLSEKIASGYLPEHRAQRLAERILSENARQLYRLG